MSMQHLGVNEKIERVCNGVFAPVLSSYPLTRGHERILTKGEK